jgi:hypothetical protein
LILLLLLLHRSWLAAAATLSMAAGSKVDLFKVGPCHNFLNSNLSGILSLCAASTAQGDVVATD